MMTGSGARALRATCGLAVALLGGIGIGIGAAPLRAQAPHNRASVPADTALREVRGRVLRPGGDSGLAVANTRVTLHRVGRDAAAPLDSLLTDAAGRYTFRYRHSGDSTALYFVSALRGGVAYFTAPLRDWRVEGDAATVLVFDTTSARLPIRVRGRHLVVGSPDSAGMRRFVEVYEISNDSIVTRISAATSGTFDARLPAGATDVAAGDGEVSADAMQTSGERVRIIAPIAPGIKQFSFSYKVPARVTAVTLPADDSTMVLEVLLEETEGTAAGAGLKAVANAASGGRSFRRYLAQDVGAATIALTLPATARVTASLRLAIAVTVAGAVLLIGFARAFKRRGSTPGVLSAQGAESVAELERLVTDLDDAFARIAAPNADQRADHFQARARLKARLAAAVASRDGLA